MNEKYIQAIILGSIIGLAIILDDFIAPKPSRSMDSRVMMIDTKRPPHSMKGMKAQWKEKNGNNTELHGIEDHNVMLFKTDSGDVHKKIKIKIESDDMEDINIEKLLDTLKTELSNDDLEAIKDKIKSATSTLSEAEHGLKEIEVEVEVL
ncbi:hypothetical protein N8502_01165 [Gammaproteobacteria bacterium]|nr:hypothetical protein [Gammaproteobacteria bacterium]